MPMLLPILKNLCTCVTTEQPGLVIRLDHWKLLVQSNNQPLIDTLLSYFGNLAQYEILPSADSPRLVAIQIDDNTKLEPLHQLAFKDWPREPGKTGRKEAVHDFSDELNQPQRLVHKIKTGLILWQNAQQPAVFGDLNRHPNQVINFILSQNLNHWQNAGWLLGHCAALQLKDQRGIAIAGVSGGGKSTLMLRLLEQAQGFISNDRVLFKAQKNSVMLRGIPKQPRINPGTIIHNPKLHSLISDHQPYLAMPDASLRTLEEKYDVPVQQLYDGVDYLPQTKLHQIYLLNWGLNENAATQITKVDLAQREELVKAIMKSPGVFYQHQDQSFQQKGQDPIIKDYQNLLKHTEVFEVTGQLNFEAATQLILNNLSK
ncbi:HprK-related kinase B [Thiomicrospira microaerophila]|uniref:HprK-related kinase B n=1 Tax=Thiomicrospira microaerophila TaxID=406020 RepID=UPI002010B3C4|nr:HprK-related kinase B [Thiomicrospira microaerophila]UQB42611.1 HprK-related kinase B [Thiomicrospira microaerophila]